MAYTAETIRIIVDEMNKIFKREYSWHRKLSYKNLIEFLRKFKGMNHDEQVRNKDVIYIAIIFNYRCFRIYDLQDTIWDKMTVEDLEWCARLGCKYAWYDLAHFYKANPMYEPNHIINCYEQCLRENFYMAVEDLKKYYDENYKLGEYGICVDIHNLLNKYYTALYEQIKN